ACGVPGITARAGPLVERGAEAVEHVDRLAADALADAMATLAKSPERRGELSALGLARSRTFSSDQAAKESLRVYRSVAKRAPSCVGTELAPPVVAARPRVEQGRPL